MKIRTGSSRQQVTWLLRETASKQCGGQTIGSDENSLMMQKYSISGDEF
jgi:hypothetical protein